MNSIDEIMKRRAALIDTLRNQIAMGQCVDLPAIAAPIPRCPWCGNVYSESTFQLTPCSSGFMEFPPVLVQVEIICLRCGWTGKFTPLEVQKPKE